MKALFADTSYYIALLAENDSRHQAAVRWGRMAGQLVVTDCVIIELGNSLARSRNRRLFTDLVRAWRADPLVEIVPLSRGLLDAGLRLYERRADKEWSLADCIAFVVMKEKGITDALTADHHFEQAGFKALLL